MAVKSADESGSRYREAGTGIFFIGLLALAGISQTGNAAEVVKRRVEQKIARVGNLDIFYRAAADPILSSPNRIARVAA